MKIDRSPYSLLLYLPKQGLRVSLGAVNGTFHALGKYASWRGMSDNDVAVQWNISRTVARNMLNGEDLVEAHLIR